MNIYSSKPTIIPDLSAMRGELVVETEIGDYGLSDFETVILTVNKDDFRKHYLALMNRMRAVPKMGEVLAYLISKVFYPTLNNTLVVIQNRGQWDAFIKSEIAEPIRIKLYKKAKADQKSKEFRLYEYWYSITGSIYGTPELVELSDGRVFHILDKRLNEKPDPEKPNKVIRPHEEPLRFLLESNLESTRELANIGIATIFNSKEEVKTAENMISIIDWYINETSLMEDEEEALKLAKKLARVSKSETQMVKEAAVAVFENHQEAFEQIYKRYPELDFIDKGRYEEYSNLEAFAKVAGLAITTESAEFFVETSECGHNLAGKGGITDGPKTEKDPDYGSKILGSIDSICKLIAPLATNVKIFNIKPNEVKKKKADVFGKYVAIAAKIGEEWYILVDAIKTGNAIYLWHGKKYVQGLETFKLSKENARKQKNVDHRNHSSKKKTIEIYREICNSNGLKL